MKARGRGYLALFVAVCVTLCALLPVAYICVSANHTHAGSCCPTCDRIDRALAIMRIAALACIPFAAHGLYYAMSRVAGMRRAFGGVALSPVALRVRMND